LALGENRSLDVKCIVERFREINSIDLNFLYGSLTLKLSSREAPRCIRTPYFPALGSDVSLVSKTLTLFMKTEILFPTSLKLTRPALILLPEAD
jgi:hypothetical protein